MEWTRRAASDALAQCRQRIAPHIHRTPVHSSRQINEMVGAELYFKCENFQRAGSFKIRGALHAVLSLSDAERSRGVVTHSSGNFAQAVALAAQSVGVRATIVMPSNAPEVKKAAVRGYGGDIVECEPLVDARQAASDLIVNETGATFVHPSDDWDVIIGQGTASVELLEELSSAHHKSIDILLAPVGGGGLIAGTALAALAQEEPVEVIGAEPANVDDAFRSLASGVVQTNPEDADTIADGLKTLLGDINFPMIQQGVSRIIRVTETEIMDAMLLIWERMKLVVEPSSAVAVAALLRDSPCFHNKRVGVILSGGNVDLSAIRDTMARHHGARRQ